LLLSISFFFFLFPSSLLTFLQANAGPNTNGSQFFASVLLPLISGCGCDCDYAITSFDLCAYFMSPCGCGCGFGKVFSYCGGGFTSACGCNRSKSFNRRLTRRDHYSADSLARRQACRLRQGPRGHGRRPQGPRRCFSARVRMHLCLTRRRSRTNRWTTTTAP
jgi:hypothetical protein